MAEMSSIIIFADKQILHAGMLVMVIVLVTMLTRFLPFLVLGNRNQTPAFITWLGKVLPYAIMGMLVVYCLKGMKLLAAPHGIPEIISCAIVILLHVWKRNTLLSIVGGTVCYMLLVQLVI